MLAEKMPDVSKIYLAEYIGRIREEIPLPELILAALNKLPKNGRIRYPKHKNALTAVSWLVNQVPDSDVRKQEISSLYDQARTRLLKR